MIFGAELHINLRRFGTFEVKQRAARKGRDIQRSIPLDIPPRLDIILKASTHLLERLKKAVNDRQIDAADDRATLGGCLLAMRFDLQDTSAP